ncbi:MAG: hypothetical protein V4559_16170 [Pseudomonadota bacterium]
MSRYFFHIRDGRHLVPDEEGMECRNMLSVEREAQASARDMTSAALRTSSGQIPAIIEVEDDEGNAVGNVESKFSIN